MSKRVKIFESERSPSVVSSIWKQKVILEQNLTVLDANCRLVVNRISLNQKIAFKTFKKKLHRAKLTHARIMGDKDAEATLRDRSDHITVNTNIGMEPEDEEALKKIWCKSQRFKELLEKRKEEEKEFQKYGVRTTKSAPARGRLLSRGKTEENIPRAHVTYPRPQTVAGITNRDKTAVYINTSGGVEAAQAQNSSKHVRIQRPKTTGSQSITSTRHNEDERISVKPRRFLDDITDASYLSDDDLSMSSDGDPSTRRPHTAAVDGEQDDDKPNVFQEDNRLDRLLEIQRERVKSANYEERVKHLCNRMIPYYAPKEYIVHDYYQTCLQKDSLALRGPKTYIYETPAKVQESEVRRAIGNLAVRSLTLKTLNYDFTRRENLAPALTGGGVY